MANALIDLIRRTFRLAGSAELAEYGPTRAAETRAVLEKMALVGPNDRPSLTKGVRCYDTSTPQYQPNDATLFDLDPATMCLNTIITVDWGPDGYRRQYRVVYDEQGPLQVYIDGRCSGGKVAASFVLVGSEADVVTGVEEFDPQKELGYRGPDEAGKNASLVREVVVATGVTDFYTALQDMDLADFPDGFPSPSTGPAGFWKKASPPTPAYQPYQVLSRENMLLTMGDEAVSEGKLYGVVAAQGLVLVQGLTRRHVSYEAWLYAEEAQPVRGTYDLVADDFVAGVGSGFSALALAEAMHPFSQIILEDVNGQVYGSVAPESIGLVHLTQTLQDAINQENYVFRNGVRVYLRGNAINTIVDGETVYIRKPLNIEQWVLKSATYITNNIPLDAELITDAGQSVTARILGGSPPEARARKASFTGPQSNITIEADLYLADNSVAVTVSNGATVRHTGLLGGFGAGASAVVIRDNSRYYHVGESRFGGGYGIQAYDTAYVEMRETVPTTFGFYQALRLFNSAVIEYYGGLTLVGNSPHALGFIAVLTNTAILRLKTGTYKNSNRELFYFENGGRVEVSSGVTADATAALAITSGAGVLARRVGGQLLGAFGTATLEELPADTVPGDGSGGSDETQLQIDSTSARRVLTLKLAGPLTILSVLALASNNASGATFQVNRYSGGAWQGGAIRSTPNDATADVLALAPADYATGAELLIATTAITAAEDSSLLVTFSTNG